MDTNTSAWKKRTQSQNTRRNTRRIFFDIVNEYTTGPGSAIVERPLMAWEDQGLIPGGGSYQKR